MRATVNATTRQTLRAPGRMERQTARRQNRDPEPFLHVAFSLLGAFAFLRVRWNRRAYALRLDGGARSQLALAARASVASVRVALVTILVVACAPTVDGPVERQRSADVADGARLASQLGQLPGAVRAEVTLHRPSIDPLTQAATPGSAAILVVIDDRADRRAITRSTIALARGTAPEISEPAIVVEIGATRPTLASIGPFTVEARSKRLAVATLAIAFALIAALAGFIAWRERPSAG